ncbi:hypothetical protein [Paracoccus pacificus]|uniref:Flagellar protein FliL n=1 Tax=Paracoccus pacificus TaxID=1463598 RepID=A0ABW4R9H4_9RHOB
MLKKLLIVLIPLVGLLGGAAIGMVLRPVPDPALIGAEGAAQTEHAETGTMAPPRDGAEKSGAEGAPPAPDVAAGAGGEADVKAEKPANYDDLAWFRFPTQFFVPVVRDGTLGFVMVMTLTLEIPKTAQERVNAQEFRLRDALLRSLLIEANTGAFEGNFTTDAQMNRLRGNLLKSARKTAGDDIRNILIEDIARQSGS